MTRSRESGAEGGGQVAGAEVASAGYWVRHAREAVRFGEGMATLAGLGIAAYVELGPKPVLLGLGRSALPDAKAAWLPSLRPGRPERDTMLASLAELYHRGQAVAWPAVDAGASPA